MQLENFTIYKKKHKNIKNKIYRKTSERESANVKQQIALVNCQKQRNVDFDLKWHFL